MKNSGLLLIAFFSTAAQAGEAELVFEKVRNTVVTVTALDERNQIDGEGSGVVVAPDRVVTNCHVIQEAAAIRVRAGDRELGASYTLGDVERDICRLEVPGLNLPSVSVREYRNVNIGERVYAVGNPLGLGLSVSAGIVSSIGEKAGAPRIFSSTPVSPGSSGGGLFDAQGKLIGITTGYFSGAQNFNISIPADWIAELPKRGTPPPPVAKAAGPDPHWQNESDLLRASAQWPKLAELARRWLAVYPTSAQAHAHLGLALFNMNQLEEARRILMAALQHDPRQAHALTYLALVKHKSGEKEAAMSDMERALTLNPSSEYPRRMYAAWQNEKGDIDQAVKQLEIALKTEPGSEESWMLLGILRHSQGKPNEAIGAYRTVLRLKSDHSAAAINLAQALSVAGDVKGAREMLTSPHTAQIGGAEAWDNLGVADAKQGRYVEAEKAFRKALELNSDMPYAWRNLALILRQSNRTQEAEKALRQALRLKPDFAAAWLDLGGLLRQRGDYRGAKDALEKFTIADPSSAEAWFALGLTRQELRDLAGAAEAHDKAVRLDPSNSLVWASLGEIRWRLGQPESALEALQKAEKLDPKNTRALQMLTTYYGAQGDHDKALAYMERALKIDPASPNSWSNKGYSLLKLARYAEAIQAFETAIRLQPDFANAWINLGEAYVRQRQLGKAITTLERALKLSPASTDARLYLSHAFVASNQYAKGKEHLEVLLQQFPALLPAVYLLTAVNVSLNDKQGALEAYAKLRKLNPNMARELRAQSRMHGLPRGFELPE